MRSSVTMPVNISTRRGAQILIVIVTLHASGCGSRVLLDERFHDSRLTNWKVVDDPDTLEGPSVWRVESDGWLHQSSNIWGRRGDFIGRWYGTSLVAGSTEWTDYTFSVKARPADDDGFGVLFRYQDNEHFYRLLFLEDGMSGGPMTRLDRREGPDYTELWSVSRGYRTGIEMMIEVETEGELLRVSLGGARLCEVKDRSFSRGAIGLFCYAQRGQLFDDVRVVGR